LAEAALKGLIFGYIQVVQTYIYAKMQLSFLDDYGV